MSIKLLQQIWRLVLYTVLLIELLSFCIRSLGLQCNAAKQLNRTLCGHLSFEKHNSTTDQCVYNGLELIHLCLGGHFEEVR